ncbi:hypothetical protein RPALISO_156 [Ruegeria phage RpAliso]|nr:hypothetical protein RPALISO_156 [Ruegeria phage RpAliso]
MSDPTLITKQDAMFAAAALNEVGQRLDANGKAELADRAARVSKALRGGSTIEIIEGSA